MGHKPLLEFCIPVIVPSLSIQSLLWGRAPAPAHSRQTGLILAVSDFAGLRPPLPEARREAAWLGEYMHHDSVALLEGQASWQNLQDLAKSRGMDRFAFWHVASHAFHDPYTGRLGGVALAGGDLWLDRIAELAPLPPLVTLSACSGMQSVLYEGDEPIGLSAACLAAGARQVVAGLWPVRDDLAAPLMMSFYQHWWSGMSAPRALVFAQRAALRAAADLPGSAPGEGLDGWGSFLCAGA
jgi:CHAT domain-containing protein